MPPEWLILAKMTIKGNKDNFKEHFLQWPAYPIFFKKMAHYTLLCRPLNVRARALPRACSCGRKGGDVGPLAGLDNLSTAPTFRPCRPHCTAPRLVAASGNSEPVRLTAAG